MGSEVKNNCDICFKIICKQCGWEACAAEVAQIQNGVLTVCPLCGWAPKHDSND